MLFVICDDGTELAKRRERWVFCVCFGGHLDTLHHICIMGASTLYVHSNINHELCYKESEISITLSFKQSMPTPQHELSPAYVNSSTQRLASGCPTLPSTMKIRQRMGICQNANS
jgi:hypothetical protein